MTTATIGKTALRYSIVAACVAAGFGLGAAQAAPSDDSNPTPHSDSVGAAISDTAITADVKAKLFGDDGIKKSHISVTTTNGVVTLKGRVLSSDAKSLAEADAKAVDGVKSVDNMLHTPHSSQLSADASGAMHKTERVASDSWITTKVKGEILADSVSKGFDVSVDTKHGVVQLSGSLASQDAIDHVKDLAEKVQGVKSVDTSALVAAQR
jgi:hyperosmotically inducible protein